MKPTTCYSCTYPFSLPDSALLQRILYPSLFERFLNFSYSLIFDSFILIPILQVLKDSFCETPATNSYLSLEMMIKFGMVLTISGTRYIFSGSKHRAFVI